MITVVVREKGPLTNLLALRAQARAPLSAVRVEEDPFLPETARDAEGVERDLLCVIVDEGFCGCHQADTSLRIEMLLGVTKATREGA